MGDYRDDQEALRARADALQQALAEKEREIEELRRAQHQGGVGPFPAASPRPRARHDVADDAAIDAVIGRARVAAIAFAGLALVTVFVGAITLGPRAPTLAAAEYALLALTGGAAIVAVLLGGRPLRLRTGFDVDFMVSRVWLPGLLGVLLPPAALVDGCIRLFARSVGGYHTTNERGGGRFYPEVALPRGEGRPLGLALLTIAIAWPAAAALVIFGGR